MGGVDVRTGEGVKWEEEGGSCGWDVNYIN